MAPARRRKAGGAKNKTSMVKVPTKPESPREQKNEVPHGMKGMPPQITIKIPRDVNRVMDVDKNGVEGGDVKKRGYTATQLVEKAEAFMDSFEYELAEKFCSRALEIEPKNARLLYLHGSILTELGELEKAKIEFKQSIALEPDGDYHQHLSYAQLVTGLEARDAYRKAIDLLQVKLDAAAPSDSEDATEGATAAPSGSSSSEDIETMKSDLSSAYCAFAELYMTDLCYEPDAEKECLTSIQLAIGVDETNPEGYQSMASYYLVKSDTDQAKAYMEKSLSLWLHAYKAAGSGSEDGPEVDPVLPTSMTYSSRVAAAKLCIELDMWQEGTDVLEGLLDEDDTDEEIWYLIGYLNYLRGGEYLMNAKHFFDTAVKSKNAGDDAMLADIEELLVELRANPQVAACDSDSEDEGAVVDALDELELDSSDDDEDEEDLDTGGSHSAVAD